MASSSPLRAAIVKVSSPETSSLDGPFSPRLEMALSFMNNVHALGYTVAPAMPEPEALIAAAKSIGVTPKDALTVYLTILNDGNQLTN